MDSYDDDGNTLLCWAASQGHISLIQMLITSGADLHMVNNVGWSPLMVAARAGHLHAARLLLQHGAQPNHANHLGKPPNIYLHFIQIKACLV